MTFDAAKIESGVERRDRFLRNSDYFEVETYPQITFASTRIERQNAGGRPSAR